MMSEERQIGIISTMLVSAALVVMMVYPLMQVIHRVTYDCSPQKCIDECLNLENGVYLLAGPSENNGCREQIQTVFTDANCTEMNWGTHAQRTYFVFMADSPDEINLCASAWKLRKSIYPDICDASLLNSDGTDLESIFNLSYCFYRQHFVVPIIFAWLDMFIEEEQEEQEEWQEYINRSEQRCSLYKGLN